MSDLAALLTEKEQLNFTQLTALTVDPSAGTKRNLATFIDQPNQLGALSICASGAASVGTKVLSTTAYVSGSQTKIDVYRLPLAL
ncbi:MAG: hypothetical protein ABSA48_08335 [Terracidiphilus sp.]|jgi:hypothetical protein